MVTVGEVGSLLKMGTFTIRLYLIVLVCYEAATDAANFSRPLLLLL